jgi:hypothetical protein
MFKFLEIKRKHHNMAIRGIWTRSREC